ncbi:MAG: DUF1893 domain-containing protein [Anaerolineaceae bacterium]
MSLNELSLLVQVDGNAVFQSNGNWLYPLFDLEEYLTGHPIDLTKATLFDKVVGKASALLMVRLGVRCVHGSIMSELAMEVFQHHNIPYSYDEAVNRISCQTELLLATIDDLDEAYQILCKRAQRC